MGRSRINMQIAEEAASWAITLDAGELDAIQRRDLAAWLKESPVHVEELIFAVSLMEQAGSADAKRTIDIASLLDDSMADVVPLFSGASGTETGHEATALAMAEDDIEAKHPKPNWYRPALAASVAAVGLFAASLATGIWHYGAAPIAIHNADQGEDDSQTFATDIGEQRSVVLDDGSIVHLNAYSKIEVDLGSEERLIELVSGEAVFEVAHDESRPFLVTAGPTVARAVGTIFNVDRTGDKVNITVLEGRVLVVSEGQETRLETAAQAEDQASANRPVILAAGELASVDIDSALRQIGPANLQSATAWRDRELNFDSEPLEVIAIKFNRYNKSQIEIADRELAQNRYSGVFDADDPDSFLAFLELTGRYSLDRSIAGKVIVSQP